MVSRYELLDFLRTLYTKSISLLFILITIKLLVSMQISKPKNNLYFMIYIFMVENKKAVLKKFARESLCKNIMKNYIIVQ